LAPEGRPKGRETRRRHALVAGPGKESRGGEKG